MRRVVTALSVLCFAFYAAPVLAASYYEFAPDYAQSILVASSDTVQEIFLPLNEFLSGFDLWMSNGSTPGDATFDLIGPNGQVLATRTVTLGAIPDDETGTLVHVNLPHQIAVTGNAAYRIRIQSTLPTLRLYYSPQIRLLTYNGVPAPLYTGGLARIGSEDQAYSFKFALYETAETLPPVISNATVVQTVIDQVALSFNANEPVDYQVHYGSNTVAWTGSYTSCSPGIQICTVHLPVSPGTTYSYTLSVKDVWGNTSSFSGAFTSLDYGQTSSPTPTAGPGSTPTPTPTAPPDTTAPVIINPRVAVLTPTNASFAWTTNEAANGTVVVQLTPVLITVGGNTDATLELEHFVTVGGLGPDTYYQATITSADAANNITTAAITFLTPKQTGPTPTPAPSPTGSVSPTSTSTATATPTPSTSTSAGTGETSIAWSAPASGEPEGGYRIDVFDQNNKLIKTLSLPPGTHQAQLGQLPLGDNRVVIYAEHDGAFEKVAPATTVKVHNVSTLERLVLLAPYILGGLIVAVGLAVGILKMRARRKPPTAAPVSGGPASVPK